MQNLPYALKQMGCLVTFKLETFNNIGLRSLVIDSIGVFNSCRSLHFQKWWLLRMPNNLSIPGLNSACGHL